MNKFIFYLTTFLCLFLTKMTAQQTFEERARTIAAKIETITTEEKAALKLEVESVNMQLQNGVMTAEQADEKKLQLADARAKSIEFRVSQAEQELKDLVQEKVDGKIKAQDSTKGHSFSIIGGYSNHKKDKSKEINGEHRTTSQMVFAAGLNNLATNKSVAHSDFRVWDSHFYELGLTGNTRILKNNNLMHAKYGLSVMYNNLRPTENRLFIENDKQTDLVKSEINLEDSRFRNVYLVVPVHLEFDFSGSETKDDKRLFRTHESFRFGLGGYGGVNLKSKQILEYEDANGNDVTEKTKGAYNVNDFVYGVSAYIGYKEVSLYVKYDINPLFEDNIVEQNNVSAGLRFDFN